MPRLCVIAFSAVLLAVPALAQGAASDQDKCPPDGAMRARMAAMFSPEQRLMMFADAQKATADGSIDMQDYRAMQRDKIRAMSPDQRQAYFADLTKRYNALPPAEQKALKEKAEAARAAHPMMGGGRMGGAMKGGAMKGANCPPSKG